ncbi:MAG: UDP-N-acetylmuramate dehydrogenase [Treponema sp.]|nr:UDP-N-acetylmuramate dehydrogenase [Treponema sp.]
MENFENFINHLQNSQEFSGEIKTQVSLAQKTTFKIGGNAALFVSPATEKSFELALNYLVQNQLKYFILGGGSNTVFPDATFQGVILSTEKISHIEISSQTNNQVFVTCNAGTTVSSFVNFCTKNLLTGAEQFAGLPGSIGGAVYMNARCFDKSFSDILVSTTHIDFSIPSNIQTIITPYNPSHWDYKQSPFQNGNKLITSATFKLIKTEPQNQPQIEQACKKYIAERVDKGHFKYPSAGSVFKNNRDFGQPSGKIIDNAGLKGLQIGGAQVAPFHGNFIINVNNAKATDVKQLVETIQKKVYEKYSFKLEPEIIFVDK